MQQGTDGADVLTGHPLMPGELYGLGGDDTLTGYEGDYLDGGAGNDVLYGAKYGSMQGGTGNDTMHGSAEDDYYRFEAGDGADTVIDSTGYDSFSFGPGITPDDVTLSLEGGALLLTYPGGSITLANSLGIRSAGAGWTEFDFSIDGVQFDDGSYWEQADILSRLYQRVDGTDGADAISADSLMAQQIYGGAGDDAITGSGAASFLCGEAGNDSISGGAGNELLLGGEGDDTLAGGAGNDSLVGGDGNDVFLFQRGDGVDRIFVADSGVVELPSEGGDSGGESVPKTDAIEFGADIDPSDVVMSRSGTDLVLRIKGTQDALTVDGYFSGGEENPQTMVEEIRFADGTVWNALTIRNATTAGTDTADTLYGNNWSGGVLSGLGGDDTLNGGDADETLLGGEGNDMLSGGRGSDLLDGGAGNDTINPGSGYKTIAFGRGSGHDFVLKHRDSSWGWSYRDILIGAGLGPDDLTFQTQGQNLLITINDTGDELVLEGALEGDVIQCSLEFEGGVYWGGYDIANRIVSAQELTLTGTSGYDTLTGGWGDDSLLGLGGDDNLAGGTGNDTLDGGAGSDNLDGGFGRDVYLYNRGYGNDYATYCTAGTPDLVQLGAGLRPEDIELGLYHYNMGGLILDLASFQLSDCGWSMFTMRGAGPQTSSYPQSLTASAILEWTSSPMDDLYIKVRDTSEYLTLSNYDFTNGAVPYEGGPKLEGIRFSDGQFWDWQTIKSKVQISTEGADTILGFGDADLIHGKGGNDLIHGGDGNDTLYGDDGDDVINGGYGLDKVYGGAGNDTLAGSWLDGGEGNDTYQGGYQSTYSFGRGSGHDKAVNGYACTVELKEGLDSESIAVTRGGAGNADLILTIKDTGDTLTMQGWFSRLSSPALRAVQFQDGTQWSPAMLTGQANGHAPVVQEALADAVAPEDAAFSLTLPASAFVDVDAGSVLSYTAHLADGQPLPAWLSFNAATRTFSGTPGAGEIGSLAIKVLATDQFGACASQAFALEVSPVNDAPVPGPQVSLGALAENGGSVTFSEGQLLANATDEEGSALTAQGLAVSADQGSLVNNGDGTWTFTPAAGFSGLATVSYLVSDGGASSPASAAITVTPVNDLLSGGAGNDTLAGGGGNNLLHAGTGDDSLGAGSGNNIYVGGAGADALATGAGRNVILFNKGDGTDAVISSDTKQDDTLSLGGGICQTDVSLSKSGDDLVLSDGAGGSLAFKDWYASGASARKSVLNLQIIEEAATEFDAGSANALVDNKVETFNFAGIVSAFDAALAENSALSSWAISNALAANSLGGSDTAALGGDFAQQYGTCGNFSAMGQSAAQRVLSDAACGASAQTFQSPTALQEGAFKLS
ncbi:MAG TPA: calcium-binding protein [Humidesulfovibrio sp.]|uniref:calcium-binding protein n=1 Tax=Humidesulfovibrio sp. TaxID=2910988 RepID=UPI002BF93E4E|nr:calcium-binding protein [Humidesulfovibrio sp.]HWR04391.1 calcium-binding protein [Humidesulfovibrio sp.]